MFIRVRNGHMRTVNSSTGFGIKRGILDVVPSGKKIVKGDDTTKNTAITKDNVVKQMQDMVIKSDKQDPISLGYNRPDKHEQLFTDKAVAKQINVNKRYIRF